MANTDLFPCSDIEGARWNQPEAFNVAMMFGPPPIKGGRMR